ACTSSRIEGRKAMRYLLVVCAALSVALGVVCGNLWREVQADRQLIAGMRAAAQPAPQSSAAGDHRAEAMAQADQQAGERVGIWRDRLATAGLALSATQLQALTQAASSELHREAETFLALTAEPTRVQVVNMQNDTNLRILKDVSMQ